MAEAAEDEEEKAPQWKWKRSDAEATEGRSARALNGAGMYESRIIQKKLRQSS